MAGDKDRKPKKRGRRQRSPTPPPVRRWSDFTEEELEVMKYFTRDGRIAFRKSLSRYDDYLKNGD